jgi:hypothetical protein
MSSESENVFEDFDFGDLPDDGDSDSDGTQSEQEQPDPAHNLNDWAAEQLAPRGLPFATVDIETAPLEDVTLAALCPACETPPHPGEFDPTSVRYGNTKDADKRAAKLAEEQAKHAAEVRDYDAACAAAAAKHFTKFKDSAALSPLTGRVVAIGVMLPGSTSSSVGDVRIFGSNVVADVTEKPMLRDFWGLVQEWIEKKTPIVGHNSLAFDFPFLIMRSLYHGLDIPFDLVRLRGRYPQWQPLLIDTMQICAFGRPTAKGLGLDAVGKFFGVGGKTVGVEGKDFHKLWQTDHAKAIDYLTTDVKVTAAVARKLGVV